MYAANAARRAVGLANVFEEDARAARKVSSSSEPGDDAARGVVAPTATIILILAVELVLREGQHEAGRTHIEEGGEAENIETRQRNRVLIRTADARQTTVADLPVVCEFLLLALGGILSKRREIKDRKFSAAH